MLFNDTLFTNPGSRIIELHCLENVIQKLHWFTSVSMPISHSPLPHLELIMVLVVVNDMRCRCQLCLERGGGHMEGRGE